MFQSLKLFLFIVLGFYSTASYSMSCIRIASGYEAANMKDTIVTKVKLIQKNDVTSEATLEVQKTYKGDDSVKIIKLPADELGFGNAASSREIGDVWLEVFIKDETQTDVYDSLGCAQSSFEIDQNDKIKVYISESTTTEMSEVQFVDYIHGNLVPTFSGLQCYVSFYDFENGFSFDKDFEVDLNSYPFTLVEDLSGENKKYNELKVLVYLVGDQLDLSLEGPLNEHSSAASYNLVALSHGHYFTDYSLYVSIPAPESNSSIPEISTNGEVLVVPVEPLSSGSDLSLRCSPKYQIPL